VIWKPIPAELRQILDASIARGEIREPDDYLVPPEGYLVRKGDRDDRVIWRVVKRVADRSGVEAHLHALRAAFAVYYLEQNNRDTYGLKNLLGHSSMQTTEVYLRRSDKRAAMQPVRSLSWAGAASGNAEPPESPQIAARWLASSPVVGAGGFEPP
jgi:integrase